MRKNARERLAPLLVLCSLGLWCVIGPPMAFAHAVLVTSTPAKDSTVAGPDVAITLKYNSRVDGSHSSLSLLKPDQSIERLSGLSQKGPVELDATVHGLVKGAYVLRWQVLSADGHISRGELPFSVT